MMQAGLITVLAALAALPYALACSSFKYLCATTGGIPVSGHTFDHSKDLRQSVVALPAGYHFQGTPPCAGCEPQNHTFEHGMVYLAANAPQYAGAVLHGMNSAGLAVGGQNEYFVQGPALLYRQDGPATAIAWPELMLYILGRFGTVEEVAEYLTPENVQVTIDFGGEELREGVQQVFATDEFVGIHISLYDATGEGGLIEFDGEKGWNIYRNVSVVTNLPSYPEQQENLRRWLDAQKNTTAYVASLLRGSYEEVYQALPGSYSSAARFVRLSMLLDKLCGPTSTPYPMAPNYSPNFVGVPAAEPRAALVQAASILATVDVPRGATLDLAGWTQVASLRDHRHMMLYWRTPLVPRWQGINVTEAAAASEPMVRPLWDGYQEAWTDVTAQAQPWPDGVAPGATAADQLTGLLPVLNGSAA